MTELVIPMDPFNPGHFYACCGLLEIFSLENHGVEACFASDDQTIRQARFLLRSADGLNLTAILKDLRQASLQFDDHEDNAVKPVRMMLLHGELVLDWWLDWFRERPRDLKCWAGQVTTEKLMTELQRAINPDLSAQDLFYTTKMMKTKFGIDPRSAWSALDLGYSPNQHNQDAATFPAVELLGAVGLQGFRPYPKTRAQVSFHVWNTWLGRVPARRAAIAPWSGLPVTSFEFQIGRASCRERVSCCV